MQIVSQIGSNKVSQATQFYSKVDNTKKVDKGIKASQSFSKINAMPSDRVSFQGWGKWLPEKLNILGRTKEQLRDLAEYFTAEDNFHIHNASRINKFWFIKDNELSQKAYDVLYPAVMEVKAYKQGLKDELAELSKKLKKNMTKEEKKRVKEINQELAMFKEKTDKLHTRFRAPERDDGRLDSIDSGFNSLMDNPFN